MPHRFNPFRHGLRPDRRNALLTDYFRACRDGKPRRLTSVDRALLRAVAHHDGQNGCFATLDTLADFAGCSLRQAKARMRVLVQAGIVREAAGEKHRRWRSLDYHELERAAQPPLKIIAPPSLLPLAQRELE